MPGFLRRGGEDEGVAALIERKGHDLAVRSRSPPFGEGPDIGNMTHALGGHHGAKRHHTGKAWALCAKQGCAHHRMNPVRAYQCIQSIDSRAVGKFHGNTVIGLHNPVDAFGELHLLMGKGIGQRSQQVGAMDGELWRTVLTLGLIAHGQARCFLAVVPGAADTVRWAGCRSPYGSRNGIAQSV